MVSPPSNPESGTSFESEVTTYLRGKLAGRTNVPLLKNDTQLIASRIIDSLSLLELVFFLEEKFGISVGPEDLVPENFQTVDAICALIRKKKGIEG